MAQLYAEILKRKKRKIRPCLYNILLKKDFCDKIAVKFLKI